MKYYTCSMCGYVVRGGRRPTGCPVCGAPGSAFEETAGGLLRLARFPGPLWWMIHTVGIAAVYALGVLARGLSG